MIVTPDTIVIKSPGGPVEPITLEQLQSFNAPMLSRNPTLHYVFGKSELAEERGLGLKTMRESATQAGLPLPKLSGLAIAPGESAAERGDYKQVFLSDRLQTKLEDLNPKIPLEGLQEAFRKIRLISHPTLIENNRAFHRLLVEGVDVEFRNREGQIVHDKVWLIDFAHPEANEFLAVNQFTVEEGHFNRRPDVVVFINGIPLAVLELKTITDANATIRGAFHQLQTELTRHKSHRCSTRTRCW